VSGARSSTATATTATAERPRYVGRFAPSPTGLLHQGSLLTAVASWLDARAAGGQWLLRIEDVDRAREVAGAADAIRTSLERFGLHWDGPVWRQQDREAAYQAALDRLATQGLLYPCTCSRRDLDPPDAPGGEARYPGTCRQGPARSDAARSLRLKVAPGRCSVTDRLQGEQVQDVSATIGDFVLRRRDGFVSYVLAVTVDDAAQGVTDVVRGLDLWPETPRQVYLQERLGLARPRYLHVPLLVEPDGTKLAKSRRSVPVEAGEPATLLTATLRRLRHEPPPEVAGAPVVEQLAWARKAWRPQCLAGLALLPLPR
jgi:glutamyl-Q tRNA(Asp) synthetase